MADSLCCATETNKHGIVKQLYSNKDVLKKNKNKTRNPPKLQRILLEQLETLEYNCVLDN